MPCVSVEEYPSEPAHNSLTNVPHSGIDPNSNISQVVRSLKRSEFRIYIKLSQFHSIVPGARMKYLQGVRFD
jgi:hypothetical protein